MPGPIGPLFPRAFLHFILGPVTPSLCLYLSVVSSSLHTHTPPQQERWSLASPVL